MNFGFDLNNIAANDGLAVSIMGMSIVFTGLTLVSLSIAYLPAMLEYYDKLRGARNPSVGKEIEIIDELQDEHEGEIIAAITAVIEHALTPEDGSAIQRITIRRSGSDSIWREAGRMRSLSTQLPPRNRS